MTRPAVIPIPSLIQPAGFQDRLNILARARNRFSSLLSSINGYRRVAIGNVSVATGGFSLSERRNFLLMSPPYVKVWDNENPVPQVSAFYASTDAVLREKDLPSCSL